MMALCCVQYDLRAQAAQQEITRLRMELGKRRSSAAAMQEKLMEQAAAAASQAQVHKSDSAGHERTPSQPLLVQPLSRDDMPHLWRAACACS
jgi:hypothetical protein